MSARRGGLGVLLLLAWAGAALAQYGDNSDVKLNKEEDKVDIK